MRRGTDICESLDSSLLRSISHQSNFWKRVDCGADVGKAITPKEIVLPCTDQRLLSHTSPLAMSFDPTAIISIIQNCKSLYTYAADVKHSSAERNCLLNQVHSLQPQLEALQRLANTPGVAGDQASMEQLAQLLDPSQPFAKVVNDTLGRVKDVLTFGTSNPEANRFKVLGKRGAAALWWTVNKAEVKDLLSDLERYKSQIGLALQHDMLYVVHIRYDARANPL